MEKALPYIAVFVVLLTSIYILFYVGINIVGNRPISSSLIIVILIDILAIATLIYWIVIKSKSID